MTNMLVTELLFHYSISLFHSVAKYHDEMLGISYLKGENELVYQCIKGEIWKDFATLYEM